MTRALPVTLYLVAMLTLGACTQKGNFPTHHAHLTVAAHRILYHAVKDIDGWTKDDRVAIVNLDTVLAEDLTIPSIVEDALANAVVGAGITVVERDSEALRWLAQEGSGEQVAYGVTGYTKDAEHQMVLDAELMGARRYVPGQRYLLDGQTLIELPPGTNLLELGPDPGDDVLTRVSLPAPPSLTNDVLTATKLLAYRIVDVSVRGEFKDRKTALRHANVAIHMRLLDARYGTVLWAGVVEDVVTDQIPSSMVGELSNAVPDSPRGATPDAHAAKSNRLWKRPPMRNETKEVIRCCEGQ
jgi:TolB-like protein